MNKTKWDLKYAAEPYDFTPNPALAAALPKMELPPGSQALDLACGGGRNALLLAAQGLRVDAWDLSEAGIGLLQGEAARRGLSDRIVAQVTDIEAPGFTLPRERWDLVVNAFFLHRPVLDQLPAAVRPGGWVFVQAFVDLGGGHGRQVRPAFRLAPGELGDRFAGWRVTLHEESADSGLATFVAQKP